MTLPSFILAQDIYEVSVSNRLNVREKPNADAKVLGTLPNGTLVEVLSIKDNWATIAYANTNAYVASKFLKLKYSIPQKKIEVDTIASITNTIVLKEDTMVKDAINITTTKKTKKNS